MRIGGGVLGAMLAGAPACVFELPDVVATGAGGSGQGGAASTSTTTSSSGGGGALQSGTIVSLARLDSNVVPTTVDVEVDGTVLVGGTASALVDFGVGTAGPGGFVARFDPETGQAIWVLDLRGVVPSVSVSAAEDGGAYVAVDYQGALVLDGTGYTSGGSGLDATLVFRLDGEVLTWVDAFSGAGDAEVPRVAALPNGDVAIIGTIRAGSADLGGGVQVDSFQGTRGYVARIAANGAPAWADVMGGSNDLVPSSLAPGVAGGVLVGGAARASVTDGACSYQQNGDPDAFAARYDDLGQCVAAVGWGDPASIRPVLVATTTATFAAGTTDRDLTLDALGPVAVGSTVGYVAGLSTGGVPDWTVRIVGAAGTLQDVSALDASAQGPVVAGTADGGADFGDGLVPGGTADAFVCAYDAAGVLRWHLRASGGTSSARAVAVRNQRVAVVGTTTGDVDFGAGSPPPGESSAFVLVVAE